MEREKSRDGFTERKRERVTDMTGPTLGVVTSSAMKLCSGGQAWGKAKEVSEEAWDRAGDHRSRTP